jgi:hypothetical protein
MDLHGGGRRGGAPSVVSVALIVGGPLPGLRVGRNRSHRREFFLSVNTPGHALRDESRDDLVEGVSADRSAETKAAFKTTEFIVYVVAVVGVLVAAALVGDSDGRGDVFLADKAWFYVTLLTVGYMVSRGLAKAGVRAHRDA